MRNFLPVFRANLASEFVPPEKVFDRKLRNAVYASNMTPIGAKLCQHVLEMIPINQILGRKKMFDGIFGGVRQHFLFLRTVLAALRENGPQNQSPRIGKSRRTGSENKSRPWRVQHLQMTDEHLQTSDPDEVPSSYDSHKS